MTTLGPYQLNTIVTGDARELAESIPDSSIDLVFTDPPYPKEYLPLYGWLAETAARVLKPGGLCIALAGHIYLNEVVLMMSKHLCWHWIGGMPNTLGGVGRVHPRQMMCGWKPALWYSKGIAQEHSYVFDFFQPKSADKIYHKWGQPSDWFVYYLNKITNIGDVIFDPFCGGGAVLAAAKQTYRNYFACEIDPETAEKARRRVELTQPPLFTIQPEQAALFAEAA